MQNLVKQFSISIDIHPKFFQEVHQALTHTLFVSRIVEKRSEQLSLCGMPQLGVNYVRSESYLDKYLQAIQENSSFDYKQNKRTYVVEVNLEETSKSWWGKESKEFRRIEEWQLNYIFKDISDAETKINVQTTLLDIVELCVRVPLPSDGRCKMDVKRK